MIHDCISQENGGALKNQKSHYVLIPHFEFHIEGVIGNECILLLKLIIFYS